jgi:hypothetical protein
MKRLSMALLFILALILVSTAYADNTLDQHLMLSNEALVNPIKQSNFNNWTLYQPQAFETDGLDMTQDSNFDDRKFFPVVAVNGEDATLILLYHQDNEWVIHNTNTTALNRPGLTLVSFKMDENHQPDDDNLSIEFNFTDEATRYYTLSLTASDRFKTRFSGITITGFDNNTPKTADSFYADICGIGFNDSISFAYQYTSTRPMRFDLSMKYLTNESAYDNFAAFDLSKAPLSLTDAMTDCIVTADSNIDEGKVLLRQFPRDGSASLCEIANGSSVLREQDAFNFQSDDWVLVLYEEKLGYLPKSNLNLD